MNTDGSNNALAGIPMPANGKALVSSAFIRV
jgi:hypothetical protein